MIKNWVQILRSVFALNSLKLFFQNDSNGLISSRGWEVLSDPDLMQKVNSQLKDYQDNNKQDPFIVDLK